MAKKENRKIAKSNNERKDEAKALHSSGNADANARIEAEAYLAVKSKKTRKGKPPLLSNPANTQRIMSDCDVLGGRKANVTAAVDAVGLANLSLTDYSSEGWEYPRDTVPIVTEKVALKLVGGADDEDDIEEVDGQNPDMSAAEGLLEFHSGIARFDPGTPPVDYSLDTEDEKSPVSEQIAEMDIEAIGLNPVLVKPQLTEVSPAKSKRERCQQEGLRRNFWREKHDYLQQLATFNESIKSREELDRRLEERLQLQNWIFAVDERLRSQAEAFPNLVIIPDSRGGQNSTRKKF